MVVPGQDPVPLSPISPLLTYPVPPCRKSLSHICVNYNQGTENAKGSIDPMLSLSLVVLEIELKTEFPLLLLCH